MDTRFLIPKGLRMVSTEVGLKSKEAIQKPSNTLGNVEEESEEKPSSSSGHCETSDDQYETPYKATSTKHSLSGNEDDGDLKSWKKEHRGQLTSSSSSLSPSCSDSSSSDNETEIQYFMKNSRKSSDSRIGSSSNPFEYKKPTSTTRHHEKNEECGSEIKKEKSNDNYSHVKFCVARTIEKGTVFKPSDGEVQGAHLKEIPLIPKNDDYSPFSLRHDDMRVSGKRDDDRKREKSPSHGGITDGPLDLSKLPDFSKNLQTPFHEPLKVGTPFDSPDSNDYDMGKRNPPAAHIGTSGGPPLFSIRNVLNYQASGPSSKLFQPYSLDVGKKSADNREALLKALATHRVSHATGSLITPPSSADDTLASRNTTGLRPILRTRGRERSLLPCEVCGKAFDRPSLLKRHLRTHTGEKPHICDVCSKGFSTSSSLNTHRRIHSGEKPHQCPICGKRFTASSNLYYHRMTHNKEKPHKCNLCGKSFPTPGDLKSHQYVHSGSWPYACPVCHRGFSKQTNLRNHLLLHSGMPRSANSDKSDDKPHACQLCDKKFSQACNLRAHIKTHESDPVSSRCCICKRTFNSASDALINGTCGNCLLRLSSLSSSETNDACTRIQRESTSTSPITPSAPCMSPAAAASVEKTKEGYSSTYDVPSLLSIGNASQQQPFAPSSVGHLGLPISQFSGLSLPGLSSALSFPANAANLHFPMNGTHGGFNTADLFMNAAAAATTPPRNSFLEQIYEWNRVAKESVGIGSLGFSIMQQKILESRLAAHLMNAHGFGINGGIQDILGLRPAMSSDGFNPLEPVVPGEGKFMQR